MKNEKTKIFKKNSVNMYMNYSMKDIGQAIL